MSNEKYEICILSGPENKLNAKLKEMQNDNWVIAGEIRTQKNPCDCWLWVIIPMKRQIYE